MNKKILIGILVKNTGKYLRNLFDQLDNLEYNKKLISIVLLEGDSNDDSYRICKNIKSSTVNYRRIDLLKLDFDYDLNHDFDRYNIDKFPKRIENLVISRNFVINNFLNDNDYVWWIDSDFENISSDTINKFIACDKDIVIPTLTHDTWEYHDCGSVIFENDKQVRFQYMYSKDELIKLDRADTHCFIKSHVFNKIKYKFVNEVYYDGCGGIQKCWSDGTYFSIQAVKLGFELYGAKHIIIKHHNV